MSHWTKLKRVDFVGSAFLSGSIIACLLALSFLGKAESWSDTVLIVSLVAAVTFTITFCLVEKYWAREPIFPLGLLARRDTFTSYFIMACQSAAQLAVSVNKFKSFKNTKSYVDDVKCASLLSGHSESKARRSRGLPGPSCCW